MKWEDVKKYKIDLEQAEETGGFIVFEEYEDGKNYDLTFGLFSDLEAAKAYADEIQRNDSETKYVADYADYINGDYNILYCAKKKNVARLYDERDKSFEILGFEKILEYLGEDFEECRDYLDVDWKLQEQNDGMSGYRCEEIEIPEM